MQPRYVSLPIVQVASPQLSDVNTMLLHDQSTDRKPITAEYSTIIIAGIKLSVGLVGGGVDMMMTLQGHYKHIYPGDDAQEPSTVSRLH